MSRSGWYNLVTTLLVFKRLNVFHNATYRLIALRLVSGCDDSIPILCYKVICTYSMCVSITYPILGDNNRCFNLDGNKHDNLISLELYNKL